MAAATLDVVGIGNAIVDVLAHADDAFLATHGLAKGAMTLIDAARADALYAVMGPGIEASGGSAGNTMAGIAALGGSGAYIGKVRNDQLGEVFRHDITAIGVRFATAAAQVTYLEGYLFDPPRAQEAFRKAAMLAHEAGRRVSLSLSDPFCVGRHRAEFRDLVAEHVDILFANEAEICALYETDDFAAASRQVRGHCDIAALTRSEKGSVVISGEHTHLIEAA